MFLPNTPNLPLTITLCSTSPAFVHTISTSSLYDILQVSHHFPAEHCNEVTVYQINKEIKDTLTLDMTVHTHSELPSSATYPIAITYHKSSTIPAQPLQHQVLFLEEHEISHARNEPFGCSHCDFEFSKSRALI